MPVTVLVVVLLLARGRKGAWRGSTATGCHVCMVCLSLFLRTFTYPSVKGVFLSMCVLANICVDVTVFLSGEPAGKNHRVVGKLVSPSLMYGKQ